MRSVNKWWGEKYKEIEAIVSGEKQASDTIANVFRKYVEYKQKHKKVSPSTLKMYDYYIKSVFPDFNLILNEKNIVKSLDNFIESTTLSKTSIKFILDGVRAFLNWASDEEQQYIPKKNYTKKYNVKLPKIIKPPYTEEEYKMFIDYFESKNKKEMSLLIQFLWHTGARIGETLKIKLSDINLKEGYIKTSNKIYKSDEEMILLSNEAKEIIQKIVEFRGIGEDDNLFSWTDKYFAQERLRWAEKKLGINIKGRGFHGFRRAFSDKLFGKNFETSDVQEIMRHSDISVTVNHYKSFYKKKLINKMNKNGIETENIDGINSESFNMLLNLVLELKSDIMEIKEKMKK
jgi:integrase